MNWIYLIVAGLFETGFAVTLKKTDNFTKLWPSVIFAVFAICSFLCLNRAVSGPNGLPIGTAYAVWTGIGVAGSMLFGIFVYNEPCDAWRLFFLALLLVAVIGLKFSSAH